MFHDVGFWWWMPLMGVLFTAFVAWLVFLMARPPWSRYESRGRVLLEERYARGEIDRDEFLTRQTDL
jgi:uncharacterized membrane protein